MYGLSTILTGETTVHGELVHPPTGGVQSDEKFVVTDVGKVTDSLLAGPGVSW